jgi:hypothetical protein
MLPAGRLKDIFKRILHPKKPDIRKGVEAALKVFFGNTGSFCFYW